MKLTHTLLLTAITLATLTVLWLTPLPLGIPGEWEWQRHASIASFGEFLERFIPAIIGGLPLFAVAVWGAKRIQTCNRASMAVRYTVLICVSWFWLNQVQKTTPPLHQMLKPYWVLYDKSSSGYFYEAAFEIDSVDTFLATYEDRMREGEVLHVGTHPPGLFLLSKLFLNACEYSPNLTWFLNGFEDKDVRTAFRTVEAESAMGSRLSSTQLAALHLLSSLTTFAVILTIIPLAIISSQLSTRVASWRACCLWITLPCLAVFLPKSDLLFPLSCTSVLMFCVLAMNGSHRILWAGIAGITLWCGLMLSLAHLPILVFIVILMAIRTFGSPRVHLRNDAIIFGTMSMTVALLSIAWTLSTECDIVAIWQLNLQNHEGFYGQFTRTWWKWLMANPVELSIAVGPAVVVTACAGLRAAVKQEFFAPSPVTTKKISLESFCLAATMTLALLWLSGKNQGEAARLWCFLTPWLILLAAKHLQTQNNRSRPWAWLFAVQLFADVVVVAGVSGFSF